MCNIYSIILFVSSFILSFAVNDNMNSTLCYNKIALKKTLELCNRDDYCCFWQAYDTQFKKEETNKLPFYENLNTCKKSCLFKVPPLNMCTRSKLNYNIYQPLNSCYDVCFANAYNCPTVVTVSTNKKTISVSEIIIIVIILSLIFGGLSYVVCCSKNDAFHVRRNSSKIHIARTSDVNYSV